MATGHDVIVIGGGPIGLACALLLAEKRIGCCVLDAVPLRQAQGDGRLLALSRGSWEILEPLLEGNLPRRAAIREVYVSSAGDFGSTRISADDFGGAGLGATVLYGDLLAALAARAADRPRIEIRRPMQATEVRQRPDRVDVRLADGNTLQAAVAVHAEGNAADRSVTVDDWAIIADVLLRPRQAGLAAGAAFERFTRSGPLALLPTPASGHDPAQRTLALVWCMNAGEARRRAPLDDAELIAELQSAIGARIGTVTAIGPRRAVALPRRVREQVNRHRVVALGNAAQTLHPVAGQGFNLGLRDCVTLADELTSTGVSPAALSRYARRRHADRTAIALLTRALPGIFATDLAPVALARGLGLALLDAAPPLRRELASVLMFGARS
jgi:2-octaprenyl-6-methoxyphenol hydroxylase